MKYTKKDFMDNVSGVIANNVGIAEADVSSLSMFNYLVHMGGELFESAQYDSIINQREMFPITAQFEENMFKYSANSNIGSTNATPAYSQCYMSFRQDDMLAQASFENGMYVYTINDFNIVLDNEYNFTLDYPVEIRLVEGVNSEYSCTARYVKDYDNPVSEISNLFIKTRKQGADEFLLELDIRQYVKTSITHSFNSLNPLENSTFRVSFNDQLTDFTVLYTENANTDVVQLGKTLIFDHTADVNTVYYKRSTLNDIDLVFKPSSFYPKVNSSIEVIIYSTKGSEANFNYDGQNIVYDYTPGQGEKIGLTLVLDDSRLGVDSPDIEEIRQRVILNDRQRDSIVSTDDLSQHFLNYDSVEYKLIKRSHTNINMNYEVFAKLRAGDNFVIPTNTLNVDITDDKWDVNRGDIYMLHDFAHVVSEPAMDVRDSTVQDRPTTVIDDSTDPTTFHYATPFIIQYDQSIDAMSLYSSYVNKATPAEMMMSNRYSQMSYIVNRIRSVRENTEKTYMFTFNVITNLSDKTDLIHEFDTNGDIVDKDYIAVYLTLGANLAGYVKAKLVDYNEDEDYYIYEAVVDLNELFINSAGELEVKLHDPSDAIITTNVKVLDQTVGVYVFSKENTREQETTPAIHPGTGFTLINRYQMVTNLFEDYTAEIKLPTERGTGTTKILRVPLVRYTVFTNPDYSNLVQSIIDYNAINLRTLYLTTEQNYDVNLWFYNTYGRTENLILGVGLDTVTIGRTNISPSFNVRLAYGSKLTTDEIRAFIKKALENTDFVGGETYHISTLIRDIKVEYADIEFFEFNGINGLDPKYQLISSGGATEVDYNVPEDTVINVTFDEFNNIHLDIGLNFI